MEDLDRSDVAEQLATAETGEGSIGRPGMEIGEGVDSPCEDEQTSQPRGVTGAIDDAQVRTGAEAVAANAEALDPSRWASTSEARRLATLQDIENRLAAQTGREPLQVRSADLPRGVAGRCDGTKIEVAKGYLGDPTESMRTTLHESRHAYQIHAMEHPGTGDPRAGEWKESGNTYVEPPDGDPEPQWQSDQVMIEAYQTQPVEADAFGFEDAVCEELKADE